MWKGSDLKIVQIVKFSWVQEVRTSYPYLTLPYLFTYVRTKTGYEIKNVLEKQLREGENYENGYSGEQGRSYAMETKVKSFMAFGV